MDWWYCAAALGSRPACSGNGCDVGPGLYLRPLAGGRPCGHGVHALRDRRLWIVLENRASGGGMDCRQGRPREGRSDLRGKGGRVAGCSFALVTDPAGSHRLHGGHGADALPALCHRPRMWQRPPWIYLCDDRPVGARLSGACPHAECRPSAAALGGHRAACNAAEAGQNGRGVRSGFHGRRWSEGPEKGGFLTGGGIWKGSSALALPAGACWSHSPGEWLPWT